jgi:uncharacterized protein (UPF0332 family)
MRSNLPPPDCEHLFEQADALAAQARQTDLRRAVSAAYYGVFHFALTAAADMVVGVGNRSTARYALVYRSVDHLRLRALCTQLSGTSPHPALQPYEPPGTFGPIADFARVTGNLYEQRILADYDPSSNLTTNEVTVAISDAREAIKWFKQAAVEQQEAFLILLLFKPR